MGKLRQTVYALINIDGEVYEDERGYAIFHRPKKADEFLKRISATGFKVAPVEFIHSVVLPKNNKAFSQ